MIRLFYQTILSHGQLYQAYDSCPNPDLKKIKNLVFLAVRDTDKLKPDHYFEAYHQEVCGHKSLSQLLMEAFGVLTNDHLYFEDGSCRVRWGEFGSWQRLITAIPPLPLLAFAWWKQYGENAEEKLSQKRPYRFSSLPMPAHPMLQRMFQDFPPSDVHIHINGTTEACLVWQHALKQPNQTYALFKKAFKGDKVQQQYLQSHESDNPDKLRFILLEARALRQYLEQNRKGGSQDQEEKWRCFQNYRSLLGESPNRLHPCKSGDLEDHEAEMIWWIRNFEAMTRPKNNAGLAHMLHNYLLMQSKFYRYIVQQADQKGFDQFQKITLNDLRSNVEKDYEQRFFQMAGRDQLFCLEGRFAPHEKSRDNLELLNRIISGFEKFQGYQHPRLLKPKPEQTANGKPEPKVQLRLTAHFIKKPDKGPTHPCRHYLLRKSIARRAQNLVYLREKYPKLRKYLFGADAAANELHAGPEVFAPIFRYMRRSGWSNFTYHAGEDFRHLVSGIRTIFEAVHYLGLKHGDRIGHGTALGIEPKKWCHQTAPELLIPRGEWLDNLIFAHFILKDDDGVLPNKLCSDIACRWHEIYNEAGPGVELVTRIWQARGYDPLVFLELNGPLKPLNRHLAEEWDEILKIQKEQPLIFKQLEKYHQAENRRRSLENIRVERDYFTEEQLTCMQHKIISYLEKRLVAIESMPTSNVRIAPYQDYKDHHIFRWLGITGNQNAPHPTPILASDDPGIFAVHVHHEYAHLLETMVNDFNLSHTQAMSHLKRLNSSSRDFLFGSMRDC